MASDRKTMPYDDDIPLSVHSPNQSEKDTKTSQECTSVNLDSGTSATAVLDMYEECGPSYSEDYLAQASILAKTSTASGSSRIMGTKQSSRNLELADSSSSSSPNTSSPPESTRRSLGNVEEEDDEYDDDDAEDLFDEEEPESVEIHQGGGHARSIPRRYGDNGKSCEVTISNDCRTVSLASEPGASSPNYLEQCSPVGSAASAKGINKEKGTWTKLFTLPLQRSRSAGYPAAPESNVPAHALFLNQKASKSAGRATNRKTGAVPENFGGVYASDCVYEGGGTSSSSEATKANNRKKKRSLGIDVREKFSFFRRQTDLSLVSKYPQIKDSEKFLKSYRPTLEQVESWSQSFDALLNDKFGLMLFREFLRTEFSDENIEFWIACEEFKGLNGGRKLINKAQKIYNDYVAVQSKREVNLDSTTRLQTQQDIITPSKHTFDLSQKRIQALMEKDSYQRFLRSDLYNNLYREVKAVPNSGVATLKNTPSAPGQLVSMASSSCSNVSSNQCEPANPKTSTSSRGGLEPSLNSAVSSCVNTTSILFSPKQFLTGASPPSSVSSTACFSGQSGSPCHADSESKHLTNRTNNNDISPSHLKTF